MTKELIDKVIRAFNSDNKEELVKEFTIEENKNIARFVRKYNKKDYH